MQSAAFTQRAVDDVFQEHPVVCRLPEAALPISNRSFFYQIPNLLARA